MRGCAARILSWDGQLEDDVRLVLAVARTAAAHGARVHTRVRVSDALGDSAMLTDSRTGESRTIRARTVINATGVWAGQLVPEIRLRPSRGTHIVLRKETLPGVRCAVMAPVPGAGNRFVFALPQPDQTFYVGLTDEEVDGEIPDVPEAAGGGHRLPAAACSTARCRRTYAATTSSGRTPDCDPCSTPGTTTADLSRKHAVLVSSSGVVTVVGGKLTTYRQMAQDAVDRAVADAAPRRPVRAARRCCRCSAPRPAHELAGLPRHRSGWCAASAPRRRPCSPRPSRSPVSPRTSCWRRSRPTLPATLAELVFGVTHEGARTVEDLLDRRTRIGLVPGGPRAGRARGRAGAGARRLSA